MSEKRTFGFIAIVLIVLSYTSACLFYWRWGGIPTFVQEHVCPICPYIDSTGSDLQKFTSRTIGMGTINAAILVGVLILFVGLPRALYRYSEKART